jgi:DNA topoisomerase-2
MVGVGLSDSGSFESMSFVNGMATDRGGTHVNVVVQQVTKRIVEKETIRVIAWSHRATYLFP